MLSVGCSVGPNGNAISVKLAFDSSEIPYERLFMIANGSSLASRKKSEGRSSGPDRSTATSRVLQLALNAMT